MYLQMLKGKIHRATVIQAELNALKHTPLPAREAAE